MKIDLDDSSISLVQSIENRIQGLTGIVPKSPSLVVQALLKNLCADINDSTVRDIAPKTVSLSQQRKAILRDLKAFTGTGDAAQIARLERVLNRLKRPSEKSDDPTQSKEMKEIS